jgi:hypothetical protein
MPRVARTSIVESWAKVIDSWENSRVDPRRWMTSFSENLAIVEWVTTWSRLRNGKRIAAEI